MPEETNTSRKQSQRQDNTHSLPLQTRHKIALSFSLLLLVVTAACWLLFQNELNRSLRQYSDVLGTTLAEQTATSLRELVLVNDLLALNVALTQLVRDNNILYAAVYDVDGNSLSSTGREPTGTNDPGGYFTADIAVQEAVAGSVELVLDTQSISDYQSRMRNLFLLILGVSLVLTVTTAFALSGHLVSALKKLTDTVNDKTGNSDDEYTDDLDETGRLELAIETMLTQFEEMEDQLLETGTWQNVEQGKDNEPTRVLASILVVKVVNINTAIELLHPATLANLLREYIFYLNQAARLYGGQFQRINGESVLVCFNAVTCGERHSINALYCAGLFQSVMAKVSARHKEKSGQILEFRMAIHSGDVFLARGISSGEQESVLGKTIDISYFLCKQGNPNELIISESASSQAREFDDFETDGQNEISMPADNVSFMAYILARNFSAHMNVVQKQCRHILGESADDSKARSKDESTHG